MHIDDYQSTLLCGIDNTDDYTSNDGYGGDDDNDEDDDDSDDDNYYNDNYNYDVEDKKYSWP